MFRVSSFLFPLSLFLLTITSRDIERAFLQNNAAVLQKLFSPAGYVQVFLPEPISFSDIMTPDQAGVFFKRLFSTHPTFEFFIESSLPLFPSQERFFIRARWSFLDKENLTQHVLRIHFLLKGMTAEGRKKGTWGWKIIEIRAEKI